MTKEFHLWIFSILSNTNTLLVLHSSLSVYTGAQRRIQRVGGGNTARCPETKAGEMFAYLE